MVTKLASGGNERITVFPCFPPLAFGEVFEEAYEVIMILDDREKFATKGFVEHLIFLYSLSFLMV